MDETFNRWYDEQHVPDVLELEGFKAAQRFALDDAQREGQEPPWRYLTVYEVEGDVAEIHRRVASTTRISTPALAPGDVAWVYAPLGPRVTERE